MVTLKLVHKGDTSVHEVTVVDWEPVVVDDETGTLEASAVGGNVLLRLGDPGPEFREEVAVHDGETRELTVNGRLYARAFSDRPIGDF